MKRAILFYLIIIALSLMSIQAGLPGQDDSNTDTPYGAKTNLNEDTLRALIAAYADLNKYLSEQLSESHKREKPIRPLTLKMADINNYSVDIYDGGGYFIIKFDPKRLRESHDIFGGSIKYMVKKSDFSITRMLLK